MYLNKLTSFFYEDHETNPYHLFKYFSSAYSKEFVFIATTKDAYLVFLYLSFAASLNSVGS